MNSTFFVGLGGSLILVLGAALPDRPVLHPIQSSKNWCFAIGALVMLVYSMLNYVAGAPVFFIFLELLVTLASVSMMFNVSEKIDTSLIISACVALVLWSLRLFDGYDTVFFIIGLSIVAMGYVFETGTLRREIALTLGSALIAFFSYLTSTWVFFWLNLFFALFSGFYAYTMLMRSHQRP